MQGVLELSVLTKADVASSAELSFRSLRPGAMLSGVERSRPLIKSEPRKEPCFAKNSRGVSLCADSNPVGFCECGRTVKPADGWRRQSDVQDRFVRHDSSCDVEDGSALDIVIHVPGRYLSLHDGGHGSRYQRFRDYY